ncbi:hypothetical protein T265_02997 [Opisthorchis viverrini]|uniref:Uncharacterized protein n=1 Tax=Opisthorchis viverrini TaxID=6198 RepID=A0A074ZTB6_OPIVI|nr:hypothetical protein T265_02997 [Opisthorchis viverrini]KER30648.1 hypothetical protein T265_02997 [Opisthorchis viverrini]
MLECSFEDYSQVEFVNLFPDEQDDSSNGSNVERSSEEVFIPSWVEFTPQVDINLSTGPSSHISQPDSPHSVEQENQSERKQPAPVSSE